MPGAEASDTLVISTRTLAKHFADEASAWALVERLRWPDGAPICPHCGAKGGATYLAPQHGHRATSTGKATYRRVWKCGACVRQFSVLVGTVMEDSKIPLSKWLLAMHLLCSCQSGVSARELHRHLGITYKSAWLMAHRIRYAMAPEACDGQLPGTVEADETYDRLHPYLAEFDYRYNMRKVTNGERTARAIHQVAGKRLTNRDSLASASKGV